MTVVANLLPYAIAEGFLADVALTGVPKGLCILDSHHQPVLGVEKVQESILHVSHFFEEPFNTILSSVDLDWFWLSVIVQSLHDLIGDTARLMLLVVCGCLRLLVDWLCATLEVSIDTERTVLLEFVIFELEFCTFRWENKDLIKIVDSLAIQIVMFECLFIPVGREAFLAIEHCMHTSAMMSVLKESREALDQGIVLIPIE